MASEKHRYSAYGDAIVHGGQGSLAFAHDAKDAAEIAGELNDLLDRVAALEAERDEARADCKAMAQLLDATPGDSLGQQMTSEEERFDALLCATYAVRRWRP